MLNMALFTNQNAENHLMCIRRNKLYTLFFCHTPLFLATWKTEAGGLSSKFEITDQLRQPSETPYEKRHSNRESMTLWEKPAVIVGFYQLDTNLEI